MVKGFKPVEFNANSEASVRTVSVSSKPYIGKSLFEINPFVAETSIRTLETFDGERYVHQKIRAYTLRSVTRWSSAQGVLETRSAKLHETHEKNIEQDSLLRVASAFDPTILKVTGIDMIPKGLREYALMHLLRNVGGFSSVGIETTSASRKNDHQEITTSIKIDEAERPALKMKLQERLTKVGKILVNDFLKTPSDEATSPNKKRNGGPLLKRKVNALCTDLSVMSILVLENAVDEASIGRKAFCGSSESDKVSTLSTTPKLVQNCFGTAPVWYQQSMENGPPS